MVAALACTLVNGLPAQATPSMTKVPVAAGRGGAASTVDVEATRVAIDVLRHGGNAADAAVAAAATLGVTEPFSSGLGGGGFFVFYDARTKTVRTIDGRETAPATMRENAFIDPATGQPLGSRGARQRHLGGRTGDSADLGDRAAEGHDLPARGAAPRIKVADRGFVVDQRSSNRSAGTSSRSSAPPALYLPDGAPPAAPTFATGSRPTYRLLSRRG
jgi:gamma-glutamyltranspeptidase/glutathione hydrolase